MMASQLKILILEKMLPNIVGKETMTKYMRNMYAIHKSNENQFFVDLRHPDCSKIKENIIDLKSNEEGINYIDNDNSECIRFQIDRNIFVKQILDGILHNRPNNSINKLHSPRKKIVIDFSSPNIAKPFHVGHLRSTIIGNFIGNINKYYNDDVIRINYLGDWGTQFGMLQYGLKANNVDINDLKKDPMQCLFNAYVSANKFAENNKEVLVEARKYFADIEQGNASLESWKKIREITVQELERIYKRLGITFDDYHWESDYNGKSIKLLMELLEEKNILQSDKTGKVVATVNERNVTVLKSDKSSLYLSRDIAALIDRYNRYKFDEMLYVVDNSQTDHFNAVIDIVNRFNNECAKGCKHIKFGLIKGMSTRSGNVVFLNDILDEAKHKMYEEQLKSKNTRSAAMVELTWDILGTTAVVINDLKRSRQKDYYFDWGKALQSEGDSGIKLQYLHCRLCSLEKNCGVTLPDKCIPEYLPEPIIGNLIGELAKFDSILLRSKNEYEACILVGYLFKLARHVNRAFNEIRVKDIDPDLARQRLLVFHASRKIIKIGLEILGVKPLEEM